MESSALILFFITAITLVGLALVFFQLCSANLL